MSKPFYDTNELCPCCNMESFFYNDTYNANCPKCGKEIMLCSMCNHNEECDFDSPDGHCMMYGKFIDDVLIEDYLTGRYDDMEDNNDGK